jgi:hypothetical protein
VTNCYSDGMVSGTSVVGGIMGMNNRTVTNCYSTGSVSGDYQVGGLVGSNAGSNISNCYSTGSVNGTSEKIGGLIGANFGPVINCFWDAQTSGMNDGVGNMEPDPNGAMGRTTAQMQTQSTFTDYGWDFVSETNNGTEDIWRMCVDGVDYPKLAWQFINGRGDFICPDGVDFLDFAFFAGYWLNSDCAILNDCDRTDFDLSGSVDTNDLNIFTSHWLQD